MVWHSTFKPPWREAGPPNHDDDKVDSDQYLVELSEDVVAAGVFGDGLAQPCTDGVHGAST